MKLLLNKIAVKKSMRHGFGVFAEKEIKKGQVIEQCYFILTQGNDQHLEDFYFEAKPKQVKRKQTKRKYAVFLGYGSIYNHSEDPNADYTINHNKRIATIKSRKTIKKNEEILISYGDDWFKCRGIKEV